MAQRAPEPTGQTISERLAERKKNAQSWEDFKLNLVKNNHGEKGSAALERWENEHYQEELM